MSPIELDYRPHLPQNLQVPIGCIGSGFVVSDCHLPAYASVGFQVAAIASRTPGRAASVAEKFGIARAHHGYESLLADTNLRVCDIAVPPALQPGIIFDILRTAPHIQGILAQKPLASSLAEATVIVDACQKAGVCLVVNQNMRYDQSVRSAQSLLKAGVLGEIVLATIDMRAIPHWMPWHEHLGWLTLRIMSIHHLDTFRFWLGEPERVFASVRPDPRTEKEFPHVDGICLYILEYQSGARASSWDDVWAGPAREGAASDLGISWRIEGTKGMARGKIGWPEFPRHAPSTLEWTSITTGNSWHAPRWSEAWFPDAFAGPMAELLTALESGCEPDLSGRRNLGTMALVDACYRSAHEHRAVEPFATV